MFTFPLTLHGGEPFSPDSISGLIRWFDAADTSSISDTSGAVDVWADKSIVGDDASSSGTMRPITGAFTQNSLNVLSFDGSDDRLDFATTITAAWSAGSIFIIAKTDDSSNGSIWLARDMAYGANYVMQDHSSLGTRVNLGGGRDISNPNSSAATFEMMSFVWNASTGSVYIDGDATGSVNSGTGDNFAIGTIGGYTAGAFRADGLLGEILIYDHEVSSGNRIAIESYLASKWGL